MEWYKFNGNDEENSKPNWDYTQMSMGNSGVCTRWEFKRSNNNERRLELTNLSREWESQRRWARLRVNGKSFIWGICDSSKSFIHWPGSPADIKMSLKGETWPKQQQTQRDSISMCLLEMYPMSKMYSNNTCIWTACMKNEAQRGAWLGTSTAERKKQAGSLFQF